jgi:hypothetical protein
MSEQSNAAAERSAHVTRAGSAAPAEWPMVQLPDGSWQLKSVADALKWRDAINAALTNWLAPIEDHETPADALRRLIRLEVMAALDPKVSHSAADLMAKAKRDALEEAAQFVETHTYVTTKSALKNKLVPYARAKRGLHHATVAAAIRALKGEGDE